MEEQDPNRKFLTVGVGASAGGLSVLKQLVSSLGEARDIALVIIQHLDPHHKSMLTELLSRETDLQVVEVEDGQQVEPSHIYVIPPDTYLEINSGRLRLTKPDATRGFRKAIDHFFRSLARECGESCAAIVLSGSGSDGTAGMREVKAAGGLTLAQDPSSAEHDSMPVSAIKADVVDQVTTVDQMAKLLRQYLDHPYSLGGKESKSMNANESLEEITAILKAHEGFNLRQYKPNTVLRRIARRMSLTDSANYQEYLQKLRNSENERRNLTKDLLINVTDFFRDQKAFDVLEKQVLPSILDKLKKEEEIRVWVAGCASGEEAYSIAILLLEAISKARLSNPIKIFATDIDEYAIQIARRGIYPQSIAAEVPETYLERYFRKIDNGQQFKVSNQVRDLISFALQNVAEDPPFNHMHLISCRNLLIYLKRDVQEKALSSFYFSLKGDSYLFLGSSETLGNKANLFDTLSKKWRIYQKKPGFDDRKLFLKHLYVEGRPQIRKKLIEKEEEEEEELQPKPTKKYLTRSDMMRRSLAETFLPPGVIVDKDGHILYNHGDWKNYMSISSGEPRNEITQLVLPAMRTRLRSALYKVQKEGGSLSFQCVVPVDGEKDKRKIIRVEVSPLDGKAFSSSEVFGILFFDNEEALKLEDGNSAGRKEEGNVQQSLEQELAEIKEELQNTIEELETSTEELKASHEEALSTNEELQSANEELEASSEELRSLNEELSTVNAQLKDKIEELQSAHNDVENFFASTHVPTVFLNPDLQIQRYTPAAELLLKMGPQDVGRSILALGRDLIDDQLVEDCQNVLQHYQPMQRTQQSQDGRWFSRKVTPYATEDRRIEGVVLVFQEVTQIKRLSQRAENREKQQAIVAQLGMLALSGAEPKELMDQAVRQIAYTLNADYCKVLQYRPEQPDFLLVSGVGWQEGAVGNVAVDAGQHSQAGFTLLSNDAVIVKDLRTEKRFSGPELLIEHQVVSGISCLINNSNPPFGVLGVHTKDSRNFTRDDANFLLAVANMLSTALKMKENQRVLSETNKRLDMARSSAMIGIHDHDIKKDIVKWDSIIYDVWGLPYDLDPVPVEAVVEGVYPEDQQHLLATIAKAQAGENDGLLMTQYRVVNKKNHSVHWVEVSAKTVFENGEAVRMVGTLQDITERKQLELSLHEAVSQLREANEKKNDFLSILGHELRNPLTALMSGLEVLEAQPEDGADILQIMKRSVDNMSKLLDDLLDLNRISQNKIDLQPAAVNVEELLNYTIGLCEKLPEYQNREVELTIEGAPVVHGDPTRLEQVFCNLLINAIKYTEDDGAIEITAREKEDHVLVEIKDDGIGIAPEPLKKIFDPFFQIKRFGKAASGLGIGLALSKRLVELHGGSITAKSDGPEKGTSIAVRLPVADGVYKIKGGLQNPPEGSIAAVRKGLKLVLIEDNRDLLVMMPLLLNPLQCKLQIASNGLDGLQIAREFEPDAMLVDIDLPDISGNEVALQLRKEGYTGMLIAISGYGHKEAKQRALQSGFDYHLSKPAELVEIAALLSEIK